MRNPRQRTGLAAALALSACAAPQAPYDYTQFKAHAPRSILVLPPLDNTLEVEAVYAYLSTVTLPLAEQGYYVFPVAVVDRMLRDNGLPGPGEMHQAPLERLGDIFDADAVLYIALSDWGTSYRVLDSSTEVSAQARLVDVKSGVEIWNGSAHAVQSSSSGQSGLAGMLAAALVNQIATSISDPSRDVARTCNYQLLCGSHGALLLGPYHPEFGEDG